MHALMGSCYLRREDYEQARTELAAALARNPGDHLARWNLAACYRAQGREDLAGQEMASVTQPCIEAARELQSRKVTPDSPFPDWTARWLQDQAGSSETSHPKSYQDFLLTYSRICYTLARYEQSKHLCGEVLHIEPENKTAHLFLGNTCARMGLQDEAARAYRTALSIDPSLSTARFNLAGILMSRGKTGEAKAEYLKLLGMDPDFLPAHSNLAEIYLEEQSCEEAAGEWREILRLDPSNENAKTNLSIYGFRTACEAAAGEFLQAHRLLQSIMREIRGTWVMVPPVFLELDRVLSLVNQSSSSSPAISEVETDLRHVNQARTAFEGVLGAMEGMLPDSIFKQTTGLARALKAFEDSLSKLKESMQALPG